MSANERRIIHLTLADSTDLFTESIGEGFERKLRIGIETLGMERTRHGRLAPPPSTRSANEQIHLAARSFARPPTT